MSTKIVKKIYVNNEIMRLMAPQSLSCEFLSQKLYKHYDEDANLRDREILNSDIVEINNIEIDNIDGVKCPKLFSWQIPHFNFIKTKFLSSFVVLDTTAAGGGKSFTSLRLAIEDNYKLFIISNTRLMKNWQSYAKLYDKKIDYQISYEMLRGKKGVENYLEPYTGIDGKGGEITKYRCNKYYRDIFTNEKILIIVDEIHHLKNNSLQSNAVVGFLQGLYNLEDVNKYPSRCLLLSGTPYSDVKNSQQYMKLLNIIEDKPMFMYNLHSQHYYFTGFELEKMLTKAANINPRLLSLISYKIFRIEYYKSVANLPRDKLYNFYHSVLCNIFLPILGSSMPKSQSSSPRYCYNLYLNIHDNAHDLKIMKDCINDLKKYLDEDANKGIGKIVKIIKMIHLIKVNRLFLVISKLLDSTKTDKVIVFTEYNDSTNALAHLLDNYNPIVIDGNVTSNDKRYRYYDSFNNDLSKRLLIIKTEIGGEGLNFHDKIGNARRHCFILPTYKLISAQQALDRIDRIGRKSSIGAYIVYIDTFDMESKIYFSLQNKCMNLSDTLIGFSCCDLKKFGNFPNKNEDEVLKWVLIEELLPKKSVTLSPKIREVPLPKLKITLPTKIREVTITPKIKEVTVTPKIIEVSPKLK